MHNCGRKTLRRRINKLSKSFKKRTKKIKALFKFSGSESIQPTFKTSLLFNPVRGYYLDEQQNAYTYIPPERTESVDAAINAIEYKPLFSLIVPVYNTDVSMLSDMVRSVMSQWYSHWELIIVDDASTSNETVDQLISLRESDSRIHVIVQHKNKGISETTNKGLHAAQGDYIVLLDHDDELTPDCLYELAMCIDRYAPDYIYSDEDKLSPEGFYTEPHFKPDWSPDTMMSTMYVCHVSCIRTELVKAVGGFRSIYDGSQDWDLILRVTEKTNAIQHIPKVLYHWRKSPQSVASAFEAKPYVIAASKSLREEALRRRHLKGHLEEIPRFKGYHRVNYHVKGNPLISIIIPTRDNYTILKTCIESIRTQSSYTRKEIIIIDNGSTDRMTLEYLQRLKSRQNVTVIRHAHPFNYSELNNIGVSHSKGDLLLFLNDDTEVITSDWLERMSGYAQLSHIGAVGARLLYPKTLRIQHAGVLNLHDGPGHAFLHSEKNSSGYYLRNQLEYNWLAVTGACMMIDREKFLDAGSFDPSFPIAYNDIELCFRLSAKGLFNVVCQAVELIHHESASRGIDHKSKEKAKRLQQDKQKLYFKHPTYFQYDPFHNPNFHPNSLKFDLLS